MQAHMRVQQRWSRENLVIKHALMFQQADHEQSLNDIIMAVMYCGLCVSS